MALRSELVLYLITENSEFVSILAGHDALLHEGGL